jgi:hypothetical protein
MVRGMNSVTIRQVEARHAAVAVVAPVPAEAQHHDEIAHHFLQKKNRTPSRSP